MRCPKISDIPLPPIHKIGWPWTEESNQLSDTMPDGSSWPRISVVTPSYNQGQFIEETIRSVLLQGYPNVEYFVMDGGSTDESTELIKKYSEWLIWESKQDNGQSNAVNKGWKRSSGDIVAWLNSDDVLYPGVFQEVALLWSQNKAIGFIHAPTEMIDGHGSSTGQVWGSSFDLGTSLRKSDNCVAQQSTFINRQAIEEVGFLDETLEMSMDWDLWIRIAIQFPVIFVPKIWSKIRVWDNTKTSTIFRLSGENHLKTVEKLIQNKELRSISKALKRTALAAAYGRIANLAFESGEYRKFWASFFKSLLLAPMLLGGSARHLLFIFLLGPTLVRTLSITKRKFKSFSQKP